MIAFISVGCWAVTWVHAGSKLLKRAATTRSKPRWDACSPESHRIIDGELGAAG